MALDAGTIQGEASNAAGQAGQKALVAKTKGRSPDRLLFWFFHLRMVLPSLVRLIASRLSVTVRSGRNPKGPSISMVYTYRVFLGSKYIP